MNVSVTFQGLMELRKAMGAAPLVFDKALNSAIKSVLYHIRLKLKNAVKNNEFGWPKHKPIPTGKKFWELIRNPPAKPLWGNSMFDRPRPFFGSLGKLMFYSYDPQKYSGEVGAVDAKGQRPLGESAKVLWRKLQMGFSRSVNDKTRELFATAGFPLHKHTNIFTIPPRPLFGPVIDKYSSEVSRMLPMLVAEKITGGFKKTGMLDKIFL